MSGTPGGGTEPADAWLARLLADPSVWADPPEELEDRVADRVERARRSSGRDPRPAHDPPDDDD